MVPMRWSVPSKGWIKINVDGAFKKNGDASLGVVIRDDAGKVLLSAWRVVDNASNAEEVEILVCKEGLALAVDSLSGNSIVRLLVGD